MEKIKFELLNCYGIKKLDYEFNFTSNNAYIVYAPNGTMKTSFTKTIKDIKLGDESRDRVYPNREYKRSVLIDGNELKGEEVVVFESLDENFESDKISNLIVNEKLKKKYDEINSEIDKNKKELLKLLEKKSGITIRSGLEDTIIKDFNNISIFECLIKANKVDINRDIELIKYKEVINDKIQKFISDTEVRQLLEEYIQKYDELLSKSTFFKKGIFNHNNASDVASSLKKNKYFNASYKLIVDDNIIINTDKELLDLISKEKNKILNDDDLVNKFNKIDALISKNEDLKSFRTILENNKWLINEINNYNLFKIKIWSAYIKFDNNIQELFTSLISKYEVAKLEISKIVNEAKKESETWKKVVEIYNSRFDVPFIVSIENQEDVLLKEEKPTLIFKYIDGTEESKINRNDLLEVLSKGEQRALYILNIIFEIEALKNEGKNKLIIFDDIADSFDYKNKYAIIEYLKDIKDESIFKMIILTHNFDFYRTVSSRIEVNNLMTIKDDEKISIVTGEYTKDVFKFWKSKINKDKRIFISSIPFVRNICDYIDEKELSKKLTFVLHIKVDTFNIRVSDIASVFNSVWTRNTVIKFNDCSIGELILKEADSIVTEREESLKLENKIVLAIAIRLLAEMYMIKLIDDRSFIEAITKDQTKRLFDRFKRDFSHMTDEAKILSQVNLMTAENIHVNAFMYEPLLDISNSHLKKLYDKVKNLNEDIASREIAATIKNNNIK